MILFDQIFNAMMAWNQIAILMAALALFALGSLMCGFCLYACLSGNPVKGKVKAVYVTNKKKNFETAPEVVADKSSATGKRIIWVICLVFMGIGLYLSQSYFSYRFNGIPAAAKVIENRAEEDSDGDTIYYAVVQYKDKSGNVHSVKDSFGIGGKPSFQTGSNIGVFYNAENPEKMVIDNFWHNMFLPIIFFGFGAAFLLVVRFPTNAKGETVIGDSQKYASEMYHALFEYRDNRGEWREYFDTSSSNIIRGKIPGTTTTLLVKPSGEVMRLGYILPFIGLLMLVIGLCLGMFFLQGYDGNPFVFIFGAVFIAYAAKRIFRAYMRIPEKDRKEMREKFEEWKNGKFKGSITHSRNTLASGVITKGIELSPQEISQRIKWYDAQARIGAYIGLVLAAGLLIGGYYAAQDMDARMGQSIQANGLVQDIKLIRSKSSDSSGYNYYSIVEFEDSAGEKIRFRDSIGSSHPINKVGDPVRVLYKPENPKDAIIDRGIWNWSFSGILFALGGLIALLSLRVFLRGNAGSQARF